MLRRVFDYCGISRIGIKAPTNLLERIAENVEGNVDGLETSDKLYWKLREEFPQFLLV